MTRYVNQSDPIHSLHRPILQLEFPHGKMHRDNASIRKTNTSEMFSSSRLAKRESGETLARPARCTHEMCTRVSLFVLSLRAVSEDSSHLHSPTITRPAHLTNESQTMQTIANEKQRAALQSAEEKLATGRIEEAR